MDADFAGLLKHEDDQYPVCVNSSTGYVMNLGGCPLYLVSKLHKGIALQTLEDEYIAPHQAMRDILPLRQFLQEVNTQLKMYFAPPYIMNHALSEDNNGALGLATSPRTTTRTCNISVNYHFFR